MWETRHGTADWVCFKTEILQATLRIQRHPQVVSCVFLEAEHLSQSDVQETSVSFSLLHTV